MEILVFGGTSEGRELVTWLVGRSNVEVTVCSATQYGGSLIVESPRVHSIARPLPRAQIAQLVSDHSFSCAVDATHPFATSITQSVRAVAQQARLPLLRLVREGEPEGPWTAVADAREAACVLNGLPGRVLLTTGTKDLPVFSSVVANFQQRVFVRLLPVEQSLARARQAGAVPSHIVAMQGPFSQAFNEALMCELGIDVLVTKASGRAGGFFEKAAAARARAADLIVIHRPTKESGYSLSEVEEQLVERFGV